MATKTVLERLPDRHEIGRELVEITQRARRLRSLYRLILKIETELDCDKSTDAPQQHSGGRQ